jgi:diaminopimelate decarboxylase
VSVLQASLLPDSAEVGADGWLHIGGCHVRALADEFGTPLFVYDEDHLRARCREAVAAFGDGVAYATKAFLCRAMAALAHEEGMHLDVATGGELHVARAAGVPAERLVLHGNNKSLDELRRAREAGVGRIVVDSFDELDRLDELHAADGIRPTVLLRVTPGVEAHTHEFVRTGQDDSKFGFTLSTGAAAAAIERARSSSSVDLVGLHVHIGSQVFVADYFRQAVEVIAPFVGETGLPELSVGGGIGVAYVNGVEGPTLTLGAAAVHEACREAGVTARVTAEPGRSIVAAAAVTLYTVGTIKEIPGVRTYVSVDGGMSDNIRPALYDARYTAVLAARTATAGPRNVSLCGKHCESGDIVVHDVPLPADLAPGDLVAVPASGAYHRSMASNYNHVPRPPVVAVKDGASRVLVRRETEDDLLALDVG